MTEVFIVGEDPVTQEILRRLIKDYAPNLVVKNTLPARGSEIKSKMENFNKFSQSYPVILLSDLDTDDCAPLAKANLTKKMSKQNANFIINIAVDEAEAWLFADREGFAEYLEIAEDHMPVASLQKFGGSKRRIEMDIPLKASYFLTHTLIKETKNKDLLAQLLAEGKSCKGREYNSALLPYIRTKWNAENARKNSYSLDRTILRIQSLLAGR